MTVSLLLVHGDDGYGLDTAVREFAAAVGSSGRVEITPDRSPDEVAIDRARLEAGTVGMFDTTLAVLRQPLRAAGRSNTGAERLLALVTDLPEGSALALLEERPSRDLGKAPALLKRLADAVNGRGGRVEQHDAPRRGELRAWITRHAASIGVAIEVRAAHVLAERIGGAIWETDVERGEMTRIADSELRKLAIYAGDRPITADDVAAVSPDTRPASVFAITNAVDRREPAAAADALRRALAEGQPGLRILASLSGRVSDLIVARDLAARKTSPNEIAKRVGRGNVRAAERLVDASKRYRGEELEAMLVGLFETDLAIKTNAMDEESALAAWMGEFLLAPREAANQV